MTFETHTLMPGLRLHVKPTRQFKTTTVRFFLTRNLDSRCTEAALIPYLLRRGTRSHPTMTHISRNLESLYGTAVGTDVSKIGEWQVITISADVPNERFLPTSLPVLARALEFINELIFFPAGDGGFVREYVKSEKENLHKFIASLFENRASYAIRKLFESMCKGEPFAKYEYGDIDSLERIRPAGLYTFYESLRRRIPIDIYMVGDVEPRDVISSIREIFQPERSSVIRLRSPVLKRSRRKTLVLKEHAPMAQGRLLMGYRCSTPFADRTSHALALGSAILGGFAHSKLFRVVREKASLAYSVGSHMSRTKGIMVAYAGVEPGNETRTRKLIEEQFAQLKAGRISRFELESTKSSILDDLRAITDSPSREISFHFIHQLHGEKTTPEAVSEKVASITKTEIKSAANLLKLDTVFVMTPPTRGRE